ncbi:MAG: electron transport complex subunit RsxG [Gammaproteobacteria bacterium]
MDSGQRQLRPWQTGLVLALFAAVCAGAVALTWQLTRERIAENRAALRQQRFLPLLAEVDWDRITLDDPLRLASPHELPGDETAFLYLALDGDRVAAWIFEVSADGYSGPIRLLVGLLPDGRITAVRVLAHRETPGLGDYVEASRSDWITRFSGLSLEEPPPAEWALRRNGGRFEQFTGATITPRAVVRAVKSTLLYFAEHRQELAERAEEKVR